MPVLVIAEVEGQTEEGYDGMMAVLEPHLAAAPGFIAQGGGPTGNGWRVFELWETGEDASRFFASYIHPHLPPGVTPRRTLVELHNLVVRGR